MIRWRAWICILVGLVATGCNLDFEPTSLSSSNADAPSVDMMVAPDAMPTDMTLDVNDMATATPMPAAKCENGQCPSGCSLTWSSPRTFNQSVRVALAKPAVQALARALVVVDGTGNKTEILEYVPSPPSIGDVVVSDASKFVEARSFEVAKDDGFLIGVDAFVGSVELKSSITEGSLQYELHGPMPTKPASRFEVVELSGGREFSLASTLEKTVGWDSLAAAGVEHEGLEMGQLMRARTGVLENEVDLIYCQDDGRSCHRTTRTSDLTTVKNTVELTARHDILTLFDADRFETGLTLGEIGRVYVSSRPFEESEVQDTDLFDLAGAFQDADYVHSASRQQVTAFVASNELVAIRLGLPRTIEKAPEVISPNGPGPYLDIDAMFIRDGLTELAVVDAAGQVHIGAYSCPL